MGDVTPRRSLVAVLGDAVVRVVALAVAIVAGLGGTGFAAIAAGFALRAFANGWIPGKWFSGQLQDWVIGLGVEGDAANYVGFISAGIPAAVCFAVAQWAFARAITPTWRRAPHVGD